MPKRRPPSDAESGAQIIFTQLQHVSLEPELIKISKRSGDYETHMSMTIDFARDLLGRLSEILSDRDPPPADEIALTQDGDFIRFCLRRRGKTIISGRVTSAAAQDAYDWFTRATHGPNVRRLRRRED